MRKKARQRKENKGFGEKAAISLVAQGHPLPLHTRATTASEPSGSTRGRSPMALMPRQTFPTVIVSQPSPTSQVLAASILKSPGRHVSYLNKMVLVVRREGTTTPWV
jgi:hypothetical protein